MNIALTRLRSQLSVLLVTTSMIFGGFSVLAATTASADTLSAGQLVSGSDSLTGIACPTATTCEAVGVDVTYTSQGSTIGPGLIVPITSGVAGAPQNVTGTQSLSAIACPSSTSCVAIGTNSSGPVVVSITLGATDTFVTSSVVSAVQTWHSIACPTTTECEAVAQGTIGQVVVPITDGTPGSPQVISGAYSLAAIACPSATTCEVAGEIDANSTPEGAILPITNGVPGTLQQVPGIASLSGIACPSVSSCEAAGSDNTQPGEWMDASVSIDLGTTDSFGTVWPMQVVDGTPAVACATSTSCVVVSTNVQINNNFNQNGTETPLTNGFPGETQAAPSTYGLAAAACPSATACIGAGSQTIDLGGGSSGSEGAVTQIGVTAPTAVSNLTFTPSDSGAGVNNVTYTFSFTSTSGLAARSSVIDLAAPAGTVFPVASSGTSYIVTDTTSGVTFGSYYGEVTAYGGGSDGVIVTYPLSVAAGDTVTVVVNGVTNSASVGSANVGLSTSSDPLPVSTTFGVQQSYPVAGQITFASGTPPTSAPVLGALVEACAATGNFCTKAFATTDASGNYSLLLPPGTYLLTASPPAGAPEMSQTTSTPFTVGTQAQSGVNLTLSAMQTLLDGETVNSPNFGLQNSSSTTPSIAWSSPSTIHIPASLFPSGPTTVVTSLQVTGTDTQTGLTDTLTVELGAQTTIASGVAEGLSGGSGLVVGPSGIDITVPPVAPIHGPVTLSLGSYTIAAGLNVPTGVALAGPSPVVFTSAALDQPAPLVATDFGVDHAIGAPTIVGPDAAAFSVDPAVDDPLQGDITTPNCLPNATISQNVPAVPGATSSCDISVDWSQPATPNASGVYTATMEVPITNSDGLAATLPIPLIACPGVSSAAVCSGLATGAAAAGPIVTAVAPNYGSVDGGDAINIMGTGFTGATGADIGGGNSCTSAFTVVSATLITCDTPPGSGTVDVLVTTPQGTSAPNPPGDYFTYLAPGTNTPTPTATPVVITPIGSLYVDPSGTVQATATDGSTVPVSGATVTLSRQDPTSLSYTPVPNGSAIMSPSNRTNPQTTGATGTFAWDTIAGTYEISAQMAGCTPTPVTSPAETVPPPALGIVLTLSCPNLTLASTTTTLSTPAGPLIAGQPVAFTAGVTGSASPTGTVSIDDGATVLAVVPLDASTTSVNFSTASLPPGAHTITATYSGDAANAPSTSHSVPLTLIVPQLATQTITFTSTPPNPAAAGSTYALTATGGTSANPVTFSADSASAGICTVSAATVHFIGAGTCLIDANQAGDANDLAAAQVQQSVVVTRGSQSISFSSTAPSNPTVGGTTYTAAASASSGLPVALTIDDSASGVCSIASGGVVSFTGIGTCVIDANRAANSNYSAATQVQQSFSVGQGIQTITFDAEGGSAVSSRSGPHGSTITLPGAPMLAGSTFDGWFAAATGGSALTSPYTLSSSLTLYAQWTANSGGGGGPSTPTVSISNIPSAAIYGGQFTPSFKTSGNGTVFSVASSTSSVCTVSGTTVNFVGVGTCGLTVTVGATAEYLAASNTSTISVQSIPKKLDTRTTVTLSRTAISYRAENSVVVVVHVTPQASGHQPSGKVRIMVGNRLLRTASINSHGVTECTLSARNLGRGTFSVEATYEGNSFYNQSTSVALKLRVN